jgi:hypothetical protein
MTNEQIATKLTTATMYLIEQHKNDKDNITLQKKLVRKFLAILNDSDTTSESKPKPVKIARGW